MGVIAHPLILTFQQNHTVITNDKKDKNDKSVYTEIILVIMDCSFEPKTSLFFFYNPAHYYWDRDING